MIPSLADYCLRAIPPDRVHAPPFLALDPPPNPDPSLWAVLAQLVRPLPAPFHDYHLHLAHPHLPLLQRIPPSHHFALLTLVSLPHCTLRDADLAHLRALRRLLALDLRGSAVSSSALATLASGLSVVGPCGLRLLSLHGCPNIDDDVLAPLLKFSLLSAIDLRFTRCTKNALESLSPHGFRPSDNNSLFHPAPLSVALCSLEKIALSASIALYPCPPQSVFRLHIDRTKKDATVGIPNTTGIRTTSSTEDIVVFVPPLWTPPMRAPVPSLQPVDQPVSNAASFYASSSNTRPKTNILPLSAQAVHSTQGAKLDPFAVARLPPPWESLNDRSPNTVAGVSLDRSLKVDHTRLHKHASDAVANMVHQFASKRPKIESEFALAKVRAKASRNPFTRCAQPVFGEGDKPRPSVQGSTEPDTKLRLCRSLPSRASEGSLKPLKPITSLKPPVLPRELLPPPLPRQTQKPKAELKQTRLSFG